MGLSRFLETNPSFVRFNLSNLIRNLAPHSSLIFYRDFWDLIAIRSLKGFIKKSTNKKYERATDFRKTSGQGRVENQNFPWPIIEASGTQAN